MYLRKLFLVPVSTTPNLAFYILNSVFLWLLVEEQYCSSIVLSKEKWKRKCCTLSFWLNGKSLPNKGDWCEIVREDLKELGISQSLEFMESKPTDGF